MSKKFFNNTWESVEILGKGSFGTVYKAKRTDDEIELFSAIKEISIPNSIDDISSLRTEGMTKENIDGELESHVNAIKKEIRTLYKFKDSTNIVNIEDYEVKEFASKNDLCSKTYKIYIRMELLKSIDDLFLKESLLDKEVLKIGIDIASALEELESEKFIHRDIKPENIFVSSKGVFKLGDFGEARELNKTMSNVSVKGTEHYMAPELLSAKKIDKTVDIYSLGIVLYRFFNNKKFPFYPLDGSNLTVRIREEARLKRYSGAVLPKPVAANDEVANIILKMCAFNKEDRYQDAEDVVKDLTKALNNIKRGKNIFEDINEEKIEEYNKTVHLSDIDEDKTISLYGRRKHEKIIENEESSNIEIEDEKNEKVIEEKNLDEQEIPIVSEVKPSKKEIVIPNKKKKSRLIKIIILLLVIPLVIYLLVTLFVPISFRYVEIKPSDIAKLSRDKPIVVSMRTNYKCDDCEEYENRLKKIAKKSIRNKIYFIDTDKIYDTSNYNVLEKAEYDALSKIETCSSSVGYIGNLPAMILVKDNKIYGITTGLKEVAELEDFILQAIDDDYYCGKFKSTSD